MIRIVEPFVLPCTEPKVLRFLFYQYTIVRDLRITNDLYIFIPPSRRPASQRLLFCPCCCGRRNLTSIFGGGDPALMKKGVLNPFLATVLGRIMH